MDDEDFERGKLHKLVAQCNPGQARGYRMFTERIAEGKQLIMGLSGGGGSGKSFLIDLMTRFCTNLYGKSKGNPLLAVLI